jgi:hypothetical protein
MIKSKTAILTTVANFELFQKTSTLFPKGIRTYVIDGRNGMHSLQSIFYMFKKLKNEGFEWLIMADEDVIFYNDNEVFNLINFMELNNYSVCGVRDGGVVNHRNKNPYAINTFFSILNFKKILEFFNKNEILNNQYINKHEFSDNLSGLEYRYDQNSLYEPYYCFYFWLRRLGEKILFLESRMLKEEKENISNQVFTPDGILLLTHTWYARAYGVNEKHTKRIDRILEGIDLKFNYSKPIIFKDRTYWLRTEVKKTLRKIQLKLS